jgi:hypothetical protein
LKIKKTYLEGISKNIYLHNIGMDLDSLLLCEEMLKSWIMQNNL